MSLHGIMNFGIHYWYLVTKIKAFTCVHTSVYGLLVALDYLTLRRDNASFVGQPSSMTFSLFLLELAIRVTKIMLVVYGEAMVSLSLRFHHGVR